MRSHFFAAAAAAAVVTVALAIPLAAPAAGDDPVLAAFQAVCWKTNAEVTTVVQTATADGWSTAPLVFDTMPNVSVTEKAAMEKSDKALDMKLLATRGTQGTSVVRTCHISATGGAPGLLDHGSAWLGVTPMANDTGKRDFLVTLDGDQIRALALSDADAAVGKGGVHLIKFRQDGDTESVDYTRISQQ